jgi:hypothetical protein
MAFTRPGKPAMRLNHRGAARAPSARETTASQPCTLSPAMRASNASRMPVASATILRQPWRVEAPQALGVAGPAAGLAQHSVPSRWLKGGRSSDWSIRSPPRCTIKRVSVPCPRRYPWSSLRRCGGSPCTSLVFRPCASARRRSR